VARPSDADPRGTKATPAIGRNPQRAPVFHGKEDVTEGTESEARTFYQNRKEDEHPLL